MRWDDGRDTDAVARGGAGDRAACCTPYLNKPSKVCGAEFAVPIAWTPSFWRTWSDVS
jgi:hypothetical protein